MGYLFYSLQIGSLAPLAEVWQEMGRREIMGEEEEMGKREGSESEGYLKLCLFLFGIPPPINEKILN